GLAAYLYRLFRPRRSTTDEGLELPSWWQRLPVEFYLALALLFGSIALFLQMVAKSGTPEPILRAGLVQPYTPASMKWDETAFRDNLHVLRTLTLPLSALNVDLIVWPEAATPAAIVDSQNRLMLDWVVGLTNELGVPILQGNLAETEPPEGYVNGIFLVAPGSGLQSDYYAKQKLVPFGEYVPLR